MKKGDKEQKIVNINVEKDNYLNEDFSTVYNYEIEETRTRTLEDYQKFKKLGKYKSKKFEYWSLDSISKPKSSKEIKKYMESQKTKRKLKERIKFLKAKREKLKLKNRLEKLNKYAIKSSKTTKINDKTYNGAIPLSISKN